MEIILASGSPRRAQLLEQVGIAHRVVVSDVDETSLTTNPTLLVTELAMRKAEAVIKALGASANGAIVISADTIVYHQGEILGKPANPQQALEILTSLQGCTHAVYTGVAIISSPLAESCPGKGGAVSSHSKVFYDRAEVTFRNLCQEEILAYIATGEPFDKAGAYGIQGRGSALVERINGDFYTVMGLPISKVCTALASLGYNYWQGL